MREGLSRAKRTCWRLCANSNGSAIIKMQRQDICRSLWQRAVATTHRLPYVTCPGTDLSISMLTKVAVNLLVLGIGKRTESRRKGGQRWLQGSAARAHRHRLTIREILGGNEMTSFIGEQSIDAFKWAYLLEETHLNVSTGALCCHNIYVSPLFLGPLPDWPFSFYLRLGRIVVGRLYSTVIRTPVVQTLTPSCLLRHYPHTLYISLCLAEQHYEQFIISTNVRLFYNFSFIF